MHLLRSDLEGHISNRKKPINFQSKDQNLFNSALKGKINQTLLYSLKNVNILKGIIFSRNKLKFYASLSNIQPVKKIKLYKRFFKLFLPATKINNAIWITDEWSDAYFHWLTDALTRLITIESLLTKCIVLLPESYQNKPYVWQSLELLQFKVQYFNPRKRQVIENLYTCSHTAPTGNYNKQIINTLRSRFLKEQVAPHPNRKIFISRQKAPKRKIINETNVIDLVLQYGYEVHYFEDYDLVQQIEIMSETRYLVGLHGAGLTNILFMPVGGKVLEIRNDSDNHNNCFFSLASDLAHDYFYLLSSGNTNDTHIVDVTVDIAKLKETLELMAY